MFRYSLFCVAQFLVDHLPPKVSYSIAQLISDLQFKYSKKDRLAVCRNLESILPEGQDVQAPAREVFRNFGRFLVEFFRLEKLATQTVIDEQVQKHNMDRLDKALASGKGAIIVTAHIGNWELGGIILSLLGYPLHAIALPHKEQPVNDLFNRKRELTGLKVIPIQRAIRKSYDALKDNNLLAIVGDRDFTRSGEELMFLGKKTFLPKGAAMFSLKSGAPIVPMFLTREGCEQYSIYVGEPIYPPANISPEDPFDKGNILSIMEQYLVVIERMVRRYPTQWLIFREFTEKCTS